MNPVSRDKGQEIDAMTLGLNAMPHCKKVAANATMALCQEED
jgi:hypothetical protein